MSIVVAIIIFSVIILVHECGHYFAARKCGILVEEFALGMGPRILKLTKGETIYSIRLFPIGGFCAMLGENGEVDSKDPRAFNSKTVSQRFFVLSAGIVMNFLLAFVLFTALVFYSPLSEPVVKRVENNSPAMAAELQEGDRFVKLGNDSIHIYEDLVFALSKCDGSPVDVVILRDGKKINKTITPLPNEDGDYKIGFELNSKTGLLMASEPGFKRAGLIESLANGFYRVEFFIRFTLFGLKQLITMKLNPNEISGPVGIVSTIGQSYTASVQRGVSVVVKTMMMYMAILSANLGIMNFLPLPALDGGRLVFVGIEAIRRKPVSPEKEGMVHFAGFVLLMLLSVAVAYNDIANLLFR